MMTEIKTIDSECKIYLDKNGHEVAIFNAVWKGQKIVVEFPLAGHPKVRVQGK